MASTRPRRSEDLTDTFRPVARATLQESIYEQVCAALMDGRLRPGQKISLRSLATAMDTSPMPVREALRRLEASHVLELRSGGVLAVPAPSPDELQEIREIRVSLEGLAAERAAARMTRKQQERTARLAREMHLFASGKDLTGFLAMNREFHFSIYEAAGSPLLLSIIKSLWLRIAPFFFAICRLHGHVDFSIEQHDRAVQALLLRDGAGARAAIQADIERAASHIGRLLAGGGAADAPRPAAAPRRAARPLTARSGRL
jgi:DNA-binding GntR family transcriptional regulator